MQIYQFIQINLLPGKNNFLISKNYAFFGSRDHEKSKIKASKMRVILGFFFKKIIRIFFFNKFKRYSVRF